MPKFTPWTPGRRFGKLTVLIPSGRKIKADGTRVVKPVALCICDCGHMLAINRGNLTSKIRPTRSCHKCGIIPRFTHKQTNTPEYKTWTNIKSRCNNPKTSNWERYGGRGIKVCERWNKFENFLADMGKRPSKNHSIDRIDNDRDYCPENCRWATNIEQANNKRNNVYLEFNGIRQPASAWDRQMGLTRGIVTKRFRKGWTDPAKILLKPVRGKPLTDAQREWTNRLNNQDLDFHQLSLLPVDERSR